MTDSSKPLKHPFSADRAIEEIPQDKLGRSLFAEHIAHAVCNWNENDSLVLALYGEWGSGKTSVKNLFKCHCKAKGTPPILVEFNPWQWSAQEKIFEAFFRLIGERLGRKDVVNQSKLLARKWEYFAASWGIGVEIAKSTQKSATQLILIGAVSGWLSTNSTLLPKSVPAFISIGSLVLGGLVLFLPGIFEKIVTYFNAKAKYFEKDLELRRDDLIGELKKLQVPIIVVIDDIDRLNPDEIRTVIQLVKANSDLPKVVYFLLFQKATIVDALQEISQQNGDVFLEKIIQVGFDMPEVAENKLHKLLFDGLDQIFSGVNLGKHWDEDRWAHLFDQHLKNYFRTLRDVHRFISTFRFHFNIYQNKGVLEVNAIDLIAIESLRLFDYSVYLKIKHVCVIYTDTMLMALYSQRVQKQSTKFEIVLKDLLAEVDESKKADVEGIIVSLFPQAESSSQSNGDDNWDRDLRICHKNHFSKYFEFALREGSISELEMSLFISSTGDAAAIAAAIGKYTKQGRVSHFVDRLEQHLDLVPAKNINNLLLGLLNRSDEFPQDRSGLFDFPPEVKVSRIIRRLLYKVSIQTRAVLMRDIFTKSGALRIPAIIVDSAVRNKIDEPNQQFLTSDDDLTMVKAACVANLRKAATEGRLSKNDRFIWLLQCWKQWSGTNEPNDWVSRFVISPETAMILTMGAVNIEYASGQKSDTKVYSLLLKSLEQYVDLDVVWGHLVNIDKSSLEKHQQQVIALFEKGLDHKRKGYPYDEMRGNLF